METGRGSVSRNAGLWLNRIVDRAISGPKKCATGRQRLSSFARNRSFMVNGTRAGGGRPGSDSDDGHRVASTVI